MAFTETQVAQIARITGIDMFLLPTYIAAAEQSVTAAQWTENESQVGALILEWFPASGTGAGRDFTSIDPKERNFGARITPGEKRAAIKQEIATLLFLQPYIASTGTQLVRS